MSALKAALSAGVLLLPPAARSQTAPCLFDGTCALGAPKFQSPAQDKPVLRPDELPLPPAPRYALDVGAVPERFRNLIPDWEKIPHKNQEETPEWVERINTLIRAKNARTPGRRIREWRYDGRPNEPPFACLAYGLSAVFDWWTIQCGGELPSYESSIHGRPERGWDPRVFELEYFYRSSFGDPRYALFSQHLPIERDPVRQIGAPYSPLGYAEIGVERRAYANPDPYTDAVYRFDAAASPMEGSYVQLFTNSLLRSKTPDSRARVLASAIDAWGIAYIQLENTTRPRMFGAHAVAAVGYFCMDGPGNFLDCASNVDDAAWGRTAWFVSHDSFGDFPAHKVRDAEGGAAYRAVRVESIDEAYAFPHTFTVSAVPAADGTWRLTAANRCGKPVPIESARDAASGVSLSKLPDGTFGIAAPAAGRLRLEVTAKHYYEADGRPRTFTLSLDPSAPSLGIETARSAPPAGFYERRGRR